MGGASSPSFETERFVLSKHRLGPVESDAAARNPLRVATAVRSAKHDPLDQIDHHWKTAIPAVRSDRRRACHRTNIRPFQTDQLAAILERLPRIHFPFHR